MNFLPVLVRLNLGGPKGARTLDLHNAIVALSQLSYGPWKIETIMPRLPSSCKFFLVKNDLNPISVEALQMLKYSGHEMLRNC